MPRGDRVASPNARRCDRARLSASTSFSGSEVEQLDEIVRLILRGADLRIIARSPIVATLARRVATMKARIATLREARKSLDLGAPDPNRGGPREA